MGQGSYSTRKSLFIPVHIFPGALYYSIQGLVWSKMTDIFIFPPFTYSGLIAHSNTMEARHLSGG